MIDGFVTSTKDGADEKEQLSKQNAYYTNLFNEEKEKIKFPFMKIAFNAIIFLIGIALINKSLVISILIMVGAIIMSIMNYNSFKNTLRLYLNNSLKDQKSQRGFKRLPCRIL
ncbi:MAG: hypothetical protein IPG02_16530 [Ignavibacteria bacterium]|nr:hypothetical protein [Ignavibacteria bacterium]